MWFMFPKAEQSEQSEQSTPDFTNAADDAEEEELRTKEAHARILERLSRSTFTNHFETLGVPAETDHELFKHRWLVLSRYCHPDKQHDSQDVAVARYLRVQEAKYLRDLEAFELYKWEWKDQLEEWSRTYDRQSAEEQLARDCNNGKVITSLSLMNQSVSVDVWPQKKYVVALCMAVALITYLYQIYLLFCRKHYLTVRKRSERPPQVTKTSPLQSSRELRDSQCRNALDPGAEINGRGQSRRRHKGKSTAVDPAAIIGSLDGPRVLRSRRALQS